MTAKLIACLISGIMNLIYEVIYFYVDLMRSKFNDYPIQIKPVLRYIYNETKFISKNLIVLLNQVSI